MWCVPRRRSATVALRAAQSRRRPPRCLADGCARRSAGRVAVTALDASVLIALLDPGDAHRRTQRDAPSRCRCTLDFVEPAGRARPYLTPAREPPERDAAPLATGHRRPRPPSRSAATHAAMPPSPRDLVARRLREGYKIVRMLADAYDPRDGEGVDVWHQHP